MQPHERQFLLDELQKNRSRVMGLLEPLTVEQWHFKPADDRWSISEVMEHVITVENRVSGMVRQKSEGTPEEGKRSEVDDNMLIAAVPDRTERRKAPDTAQPTGQLRDGSEITTEFEKARARTTEVTTYNTKDLRQFFQSHGAFGELDCYQWLLLLPLHAERHARQIEEVKASAGYPSASVATA